MWFFLFIEMRISFDFYIKASSKVRGKREYFKMQDVTCKNHNLKRRKEMDLQEILKAQGLNEEALKKVSEEMKKNKIYTASEENLDIRYSKLKTDFEALEKKHGEANTLIEEMKKSSQGNETLQNKLTEYEAKVQTLEFCIFGMFYLYKLCK